MNFIAKGQTRLANRAEGNDHIEIKFSPAV
jgi:hypothetical protein